jgi:hypothetical protein
MAQAADARGEQYGKSFAQIMAKAWSDPSFKQRLLEQPASVLEEHGIPVSPGTEVRAVENTPERVYITIPPPPSEDVSDEDLLTVAGGGDTAFTAGTTFCVGTVGGTAATFTTVGSVGSL